MPAAANAGIAVLLRLNRHLTGSGANLASFWRISSGILATLRFCRLTITHVLYTCKQGKSLRNNIFLSE